MRRVETGWRPDWKAKVETVGLTYHSHGVAPSGENSGAFWHEGAHYVFSLDEIEAIEAASEDLHAMSLEAVDYVVRTPGVMETFGIAGAFRPLITNSWHRRDPHVMGRFDLAYQTGKPPKLLEYNADTPTLVIETALVQWLWHQDVAPEADQFNSLHEKLVARYREIGALMEPGTTLHFSSLRDVDDGHSTASWSVEEFAHAHYFLECASQAGVKTKFVAIPDVGHDPSRLALVDFEGQPIRYWSKLYPWEWLVEEEFGKVLLWDRIGLLEPAWKMLLSNKAILPVLWHLFPGHPNLLPAFFEYDEALGSDWVSKPLLGREGGNVTIRVGGSENATDGLYDGPRVFQGHTDTTFEDRHVVIGSWMVGNEPAGMILREGDRPIVTADSRIVPHLIR